MVLILRRCSSQSRSLSLNAELTDNFASALSFPQKELIDLILESKCSVNKSLHTAWKTLPILLFSCVLCRAQSTMEWLLVGRKARSLEDSLCFFFSSFFFSSTLVDLGTLIKNFHYGFYQCLAWCKLPFLLDCSLILAKRVHVSVYFSAILQPQPDKRGNSVKTAWLAPLTRKLCFHFEAEIKFVQNTSGRFGGVER